MNILKLPKNLRIELVHQIQEMRLQKKTNKDIAIVLDKIGYKTPSGNALDDKCVSAFCVNNGLRIRRYPFRSGKKTKMFGKSKEIMKGSEFVQKSKADNFQLENDLLEIIGSKMSKDTKVKCLLALI